jgi:hypothetical protein
MPKAARFKRASVLRRLPDLDGCEYHAVAAHEGDVCAFELGQDSTPIVIEAVGGRSMVVIPGDVFLAVPGYRESTRWVVGGVPTGGLVPGDDYWVLSDSGVVGELIADTALEKGHLGQARYLGAVHNGGIPLNIRQFAVQSEAAAADRGAPVYLVLGTSAEVGKTTAAMVILQALRQQGHTRVTAMKATGTASFGEIATYGDFGAAQAFDCVDFGLPTTYPSGRTDIAAVFDGALDILLSVAADAVLIECGGDLMGANVPIFLQALQRRRAATQVILVAADALGALGAKQMLQDMGIAVNLITGPCTDSPILQRRTQDLCGVPAVNMVRGGREGLASAGLAPAQPRKRAATVQK